MVLPLEHVETAQEQQRGAPVQIDEVNAVVVSNDHDETQTQSAVVEIGEAEKESPIDAPEGVVVVSIESVSESKEHSGGFKQKIRGWTAYVGRKIDGGLPRFVELSLHVASMQTLK